MTFPLTDPVDLHFRAMVASSTWEPTREVPLSPGVELSLARSRLVSWFHAHGSNAQAFAADLAAIFRGLRELEERNVQAEIDVDDARSILRRAVDELCGVYQGMKRVEIVSRLMAGKSLLGEA